jgi:hypothetical protein
MRYVTGLDPRYPAFVRLARPDSAHHWVDTGNRLSPLAVAVRFPLIVDEFLDAPVPPHGLSLLRRHAQLLADRYPEFSLRRAPELPGVASLRRLHQLRASITPEGRTNLVFVHGRHPIEPALLEVVVGSPSHQWVMSFEGRDPSTLRSDYPVLVGTFPDEPLPPMTVRAAKRLAIATVNDDIAKRNFYAEPGDEILRQLPVGVKQQRKRPTPQARADTEERPPADLSHRFQLRAAVEPNTRVLMAFVKGRHPSDPSSLEVAVPNRSRHWTTSNVPRDPSSLEAQYPLLLATYPGADEPLVTTRRAREMALEAASPAGEHDAPTAGDPSTTLELAHSDHSVDW